MKQRLDAVEAIIDWRRPGQDLKQRVGEMYESVAEHLKNTDLAMCHVRKCCGALVKEIPIW